MKKFRSLIVSGGSLKVLSALGVIKYLDENHKNSIKSINAYVGTSAGAILSFFLCLDYTIKEIEEFLTTSMNDPELCEFDIAEVFDLLNNYGINSGNNIIKLAEKILYNKKKIYDINFMDFAKQTGKNFVVCVANLSKERDEFFSVDTTPWLSVITAIRVTCSLPVIFTPISIDGDIYVDGGIYNNFPIDYFDEDKLHDILGINIIFKEYQKCDNFVNYIRFMIYSIIEKINRKNTKILEDPSHNIITLEFIAEESWIATDSLKINFTTEKMYHYINLGYQIMKQKIDYIKS